MEFKDKPIPTPIVAERLKAEKFSAFFKELTSLSPVIVTPGQMVTVGLETAVQNTGGGVCSIFCRINYSLPEPVLTITHFLLPKFVREYSPWEPQLKQGDLQERSDSQFQEFLAKTKDMGSKKDDVHLFIFAQNFPEIVKIDVAGRSDEAMERHMEIENLRKYTDGELKDSGVVVHDCRTAGAGDKTATVFDPRTRTIFWKVY